MLNAVWVAVIVAAAFWVAGVCAAVYVMAKAARLMSQATDAVASLREHQDALIGTGGSVCAIDDRSMRLGVGRPQRR